MKPTALLPTPGPLPVAAAVVAAPPAAAVVAAALAAVVALESDELELLPQAVATRARPLAATTASRMIGVRGAVTLMSFLWVVLGRVQAGLLSGRISSVRFRRPSSTLRAPRPPASSRAAPARR